MSDTTAATRARILLIDDDELIADSLRSYLLDRGCDVDLATEPEAAARLLTAYYFGYFIVVLPLLGIFEKTKPLPNSISESVLGAKTSGVKA